jgi:uncharacterized protein HemX
MKNKFKKVVLLCAGLMTSISSFAISTGAAVAAGLGAAAAVTLIGVGIHKGNKRRKEREENNTDNKTASKKMKSDKYAKEPVKASANKNKKDSRTELKQTIRTKRESLNEHQKDLHKLKKNGKKNTAEAREHKSMIDRLRREIKNLEEDIKSL